MLTLYVRCFQDTMFSSPIKMKSSPQSDAGSSDTSPSKKRPSPTYPWQVRATQRQAALQQHQP